MNTQQNNFHKGFTLIETLFAILIFSTALISLLSIAGKGISATQNVRQETTAHYLAQEGLEVVRNIRDSNFVTGAPSWDDGFSQCFSTSSSCNLVYDQNKVPVLDTCTSPCYIQESNGAFITLSGAPISQYSRSIVVTPVGSSNDEYLVTSEVSWKAKTIERSVILETILKKWQ